MSDNWQVFLLDEDGFVLGDEETSPETLLSMIEDPDAIDAKYGDCIPDRIVVVRDTALPKPQAPGSPILRAPGTFWTVDEVSWDVSDISGVGAAHALTIWKGAHGFAAALNKEATT